MGEIKKLTNSIRNFSESELCYGTIKTLKMIDDESDKLQADNENMSKAAASCLERAEKAEAALRKELDEAREAAEKAKSVLSMGNTTREREAWAALAIGRKP